MTVVMERPAEYVHVDRGLLAVRQFVLVLDRPPGPAQLAALRRRPVRVGTAREPAGAATRIHVEWPAPSLAEAIGSAVRRVEAVGLRAYRVDAQDWVTLGDVAERAGRSRETVRLWALGRLGPGGFPPPLNPGSDTSFYSWAEVLPWLRGPAGLDLPAEEPVLAAANLALQLRNLSLRLRRPDLLRALLG